MGKTPFDFMAEEEAIRIGEIFGHIVANKSPIIDLEYTHTNKDNEEVAVVTNGIPIFDDRGVLVAYQGFDRDITYQKRLKHKIRENELLLVQQSKLASTGEMIANIAHQLKQPLNAMSLSSQNVEILFNKNKLNSQNLHNNVERCKRLIVGMSDTINTFKNFFSEDKEKSDFSPVEAVKNALVIVEAELKLNSIKYTFDTSNTQHSVYGNQNELSQVLVNLINNAKDVLVERKIKDPKITISIDSKSDKKLINVIDNAGGIEDTSLSKIFNPYYTTKENKGTGIGLYMSKIITEKSFNGTLSASNIDDGACFSVTI